MQRIFQKVGARTTAVSIVHSEEDALWPILDVILELGLAYVENNRHSILVVVSAMHQARVFLT